MPIHLFEYSDSDVATPSPEGVVEKKSHFAED